MFDQGFLLGIGWIEVPETGAGGPCGEPAGPFGLISGAYGSPLLTMNLF